MVKHRFLIYKFEDFAEYLTSFKNDSLHDLYSNFISHFTSKFTNHFNTEFTRKPDFPTTIIFLERDDFLKQFKKFKHKEKLTCTGKKRTIVQSCPSNFQDFYKEIYARILVERKPCLNNESLNTVAFDSNYKCVTRRIAACTRSYSGLEYFNKKDRSEMMKVGNKFKITSKDDKTNKKVLLEAQLSQISGVTEAKARAITKVYPDLGLLIDEMEMIGRDRFAEVEIVIGVGVRAKRGRIGGAISRKMFELFC